MFGNAKLFNADIGNWNVSKVTNMSGMFHGAHCFNQDISKWVVSNVTDMSNMFYGVSTGTNGNDLYGDVTIPNGQDPGFYVWRYCCWCCPWYW